MCKQLKIDPESIVPKKLELFENELKDAEIAKLHHKHHCK
jgi:hypothetical protein